MITILLGIFQFYNIIINYMKINYKFIIIVLFILVVIYNLFVKTGVNMHCNHCFKNGDHYHFSPDFSMNTNHGPKIGFNKFEHPMCKVCVKNKGKTHFHL